ncbi:MAG: glycosyltransferase family 4 protein [Candidatus Liptonbacteria bacterium]|nr:glycosyltransferase family 4 protein [Candidatus Liptonbacteria bacterium]
MRSVILYAYPPEPDGLSMQGHLLYKGMLENGEEVMPVNIGAEFQKEWIYKYFKPDVAIGVGFWNHTPDIVHHTKQFGVDSVPWLVADGWVANYQKDLSELPLVLATSKWVKETYERDGTDVKNFEVAHIGYDPAMRHPILKSDPQVKTLRKMLGIKDNELVILTAGGDVSSKGAQEVFKALKIIQDELRAKGISWKYVCKLWGGESADGHWEDEQALIEELGDDKDRVIYAEGPMSYEFMNVLLNACDIYAAPSRLEGFGMIQVEAQACGKPVISIDLMGPKETVVHGETGFLAPVAETVDLSEEWVYKDMGYEEDHKIIFDKPKTFAYRANSNSIAEYLLKLLTDNEFRNKMGEAAAKHALENFEYHKTAAHITKLIKEKYKLK